MTQPNYPGAPDGGNVTSWDTLRVWILACIKVINRINTGKTNNTGEVTLETGATTTTVVDARATAFSHITLAPLDADAAAEDWWISDRTNGEFEITHANSTDTRSFTYSLTS